MADAFKGLEIFGGPAEEAGEGAGSLEQAIGQGDDVLALSAAAQEHGEKFAVTQGAGAFGLEAFLRSFGIG